jgi:leucyl-tRNA synthetase
MATNLEKFYNKCLKIASQPISDEYELLEIDQWMLSKLQSYIKEADEAMEELRVRKTIHAALYDLNKDLDWYIKRVEINKNAAHRRRAIQHVLRTIVNAQIKMLTPFTPHICEEIWEAFGETSFITNTRWPEIIEEFVKPDVEELEAVIQTSLEDVEKIIRVTGIKPDRIFFYTSTSWKWKIYLKALELAKEGTLDIGTLIRESFKDDEIKAKSKEVPTLARVIVEDVKKTPIKTVLKRLEMGVVNEVVLLENAIGFFQREFSCNVLVYEESDPWIEDPAQRAKRAKPYKPAIYVE